MMNQTIPLWDNKEDIFQPTLTTYVIDDCLSIDGWPSHKQPRKRGAVLICPGGGYRFCSAREGEPIALRFIAAGYHAFVLEYTTKAHHPDMKHPQPLLDAARAMTVIRQHAAQWNVDENKIAVCGFSAGGHLAASLATLGERDYLKNAAGIENHIPNALILAYPVISSGEFTHKGSFDNLLGVNASQDERDSISLEKQVSDITPPTFLWHTFSDTVVPVENSLIFARALKRNNIPFELHIYPDGGHGLSLADEATTTDPNGIMPHVQTWMALCIQWINKIFKR